MCNLWVSSSVCLVLVFILIFEEEFDDFDLDLFWNMRLNMFDDELDDVSSGVGGNGGFILQEVSFASVCLIFLEVNERLSFKSLVFSVEMSLSV